MSNAGGQPGHSKHPQLVRFYCQNCRLDTTIAIPQIRTCPRCRCGIALEELYPGQVKLGAGYIDPLTLTEAPTYMPAENFDQDKRNSGFNLNPTDKTSGVDE